MPAHLTSAAAPTSQSNSASQRVAATKPPAAQRLASFEHACVETQVVAILSTTLAKEEQAEKPALSSARLEQDCADPSQAHSRFCAGWWLLPGACLGSLSWVGLLAALL